MRNLFTKVFLVTSVTAGVVYGGVLRAEDAKLVQTNLVSDIPGLATITDPELHNPWGVSHSPTSPFWVSNQGTNTATLYAVTDETNVMKVTAVNPPTGISRSRKQLQDRKDRLARSTIRTLRRSQWEKAETVVPRTSSSRI